MKEKRQPLVVERQGGIGSTLSEWMTAVTVADPSKQEMVASFVLQDWQKMERLFDLHESMGLPISQYLCLESTHFTPEATEIRTYFASHKETRFAIRALPLQPGLMPGRVLDITQEACFAYVHHLSRTGGRYQIYLWEYFLPEFSGTIIVTTYGLYAEMVRGSHFVLTQQSVEASALMTASLTFPQYHMVYSMEDSGARTVLWRAITLLMRETCGMISPLSLPKLLKGYFEFSFHAARGYRFFDCNTHPFIVQLPFSGDLPDIFSFF